MNGGRIPTAPPRPAAPSPVPRHVAHLFRNAVAKCLVFDTAVRGWMGRTADRLGLAGLLDCAMGSEGDVEIALSPAHHAAVAGSPLALHVFAL